VATWRAFGLCLAAAWIALASGCASMPGRDPIQVNVVGVEPLPSQGAELRMAVKLRLQNPNDTALDYDGISLNLDVAGKPFASGVSPVRGAVPRYGETVLSVPVSVSALAMIRQALGLASGESASVDYRLSGKVGGSTLGPVRFESRGQLELPPAP